jgi:hypothetical protein
MGYVGGGKGIVLSVHAMKTWRRNKHVAPLLNVSTGKR